MLRYFCKLPNSAIILLPITPIRTWVSCKRMYSHICLAIICMRRIASSRTLAIPAYSIPYPYVMPKSKASMPSSRPTKNEWPMMTTAGARWQMQGNCRCKLCKDAWGVCSLYQPLKKTTWSSKLTKFLSDAASGQRQPNQPINQRSSCCSIHMVVPRVVLFLCMWLCVCICVWACASVCPHMTYAICHQHARSHTHTHICTHRQSNISKCRKTTIIA